MAQSKRKRKPKGVVNPTAGQDERQLNKGYSNPPAPKKKKKRPVRVQAPTAGQDERQLNKGYSNPPAPKRTTVAPNEDVVRRQRLLRAAGFPIVVDGRWGGRSQ